MNAKNDLRIIKTRRLLYDSLINLMKDKPIEEIKVADICEKAMINRSTFYAQYSDKYELLYDYIMDLKKNLATELEKNTNISNSKEYYIEMIRLFLNHIEEKGKIYTSIMINNKNSITMDMVYDALNEDVKKRLASFDAPSHIPIEIVSKFYIGAVFNIGIEWLKNRNKYTKEELIKYLEELIPNNTW